MGRFTEKAWRLLAWAALIGLCVAFSDVWGQSAASTDTLPAGTSRQEVKQAANRVGDFLKGLFEISPESLRTKFLRIAVVALIGLIAMWVMKVITWINQWIVYSEWGPLRYVFRQHQRSITLNSLVINLIKYVIYFTALGYILIELGINYKTYLASLSLIGIAVGFGSQGLVQDIVTGFFILFENQFSVGDMVELTGQFGIVEEIGLRTTRLRNYLGELMIFPNRNIAVVGRFLKGAMEVCVDVALANKEMADKAAAQLQQIGNEFGKQFQEIVLEGPEVSGLIVLETGEFFIRMLAKIWPQQQWVIEQQMVPRICEIFKREGIEIPGDRVVVFYHLTDREVGNQNIVQRIRDMVSRSR
ncbi:MAG: mechanosensitive ion channel domain-containing protein [Candidatus Latescibacterota bacterium]